jgi:hypothetical protein
MTAPVVLIPLRCLRCETPVPAQPEEVAWRCSQCGQGLLLDESKGLVPLEIHCSADILPNRVGKPFWVAEGQVTVQRDTYSGDKSADAQRFWGGKKLFIIPAFAGTLESLLSLSMQFLQQPPELQPGPDASFEPVTLSPADLTAAAEYLVMAIEAGRKDSLKVVSVGVSLSAPSLWVLP